MASELPVRIEFELPEGWQSAPPDEVGAPGVAFIALHPASADGFTANITIAGQIRDPDLSMETIADESVQRLAESLQAVSILQRDEIGSAAAPGMVQKLELTTAANDETFSLVQCQVHVSMQDVDDPAKRAVLELALTCEHTQLDEVFGDFQRFAESVRPTEESGAAATETASE